MTPADIATRRLAAQRISATTFTRPEQVVAALGAVQAQDYLGALWAIGLRMKEATEARVERALAGRKIVRTWPMRGTLHFVAAEDARWMVELMAPRAAAAAVGRLRKYGIDDRLLARARDAMVRALEGGRTLTRPAAYEVLERAKMSTANQRGLHLLWCLAHEAVLCFGPREGKQQTFVLFEEWLPKAKRKSRDEALGELAHRYFAGHGPATLADFAWWSGLKVADAQRGVELAGKLVTQETIAGQAFWLASRSTAARPHRAPAYVLPAFDELLVGYTDRRAFLEARHARFVNNGGGILNPTIVVNDRVVGTWQRRISPRGVRFELAPFARPSKPDREAVDLALDRYARFVGLTRMQR
jgi:hypothetical protein